MHRQTLIRILAVLVVFGGLWVASTQQDQPLEINEVRDNLHVIFGPGGNIGVLVTDEGVILVDDKFDRHVPEILSKVKTVTDQPVRYVLNTHHHGDHTGGNQKLQKSAQIIAHRNARKNMIERSQPGAPAVTFASETSVFLGGQEVRAHHLGRGHTNGDSVIHYPAQRVIHTGDLFVRSSPFIDYSAGGSALEWDKTLAAILELDFDTVIPGHGPIATRDDIVRWKKDFETFRSRVSELTKQGVPAGQLEAKLSFDGLKGWTMNRLIRRSLPGLHEELAN